MAATDPFRNRLCLGLSRSAFGALCLQLLLAPAASADTFAGVKVAADLLRQSTGAELAATYLDEIVAFEDEVITGGADLDDFIIGGPGPDDVITGGPGPDDVITGGPGPDDVITGGPGPDDVITGVPEPSSLLLLGMALTGLAVHRRRRA